MCVRASSCPIRKVLYAGQALRNRNEPVRVAGQPASCGTRQEGHHRAHGTADKSDSGNTLRGERAARRPNRDRKNGSCDAPRSTQACQLEQRRGEVRLCHPAQSAEPRPSEETERVWKGRRSQGGGETWRHISIGEDCPIQEPTGHPDNNPGNASDNVHRKEPATTSDAREVRDRG